MKNEGSSNEPAEVDSDWVVDRESCMACGAPPNEAPDLMHLGDTCYFKKQPETPEEIERACRAAWASCCNQVEYVGSDPAIKLRIRELTAAGGVRRPLGIREWLTLGLIVTAGLLVVGFVVYLLSTLVRPTLP